MKRSAVLASMASLAFWLTQCGPADATDFGALESQRHPSLVGSDGPLAISSLNQLVNTYADLSVNAARGATTITVSNGAALGVLRPGDLLLIMQMQGATIDTIDSSGYGAVTAINGAGLYELVGLTSASGNTLTLDATCGGLRNNYSVAGRTQVLRVPQYTTLDVPSGTSITAPAWNGLTGGVVAITAQTSVSLSGGNIDVSGKGFRGGPSHQNSRATSNTLVSTYRSTNPQDAAEKGEGVAGFETDLPNGYYGRGAPANGGGGGNYQRSGGGGGANGDNSAVWTGQGVMDGNAFGTMPWSLDSAYQANGNKLTASSGGGRGGYTLSSNNQDARTVAPGDATWGSNLRQQVGGLGGYPLTNNPATRLFLGGGGGAGDESSTAGSGSNGGAGGGLVLVFTRDLSGSGVIAANGSAGANSRASDDGAGGGGAGGSIVASASRALSGISLQANGGAGGLVTATVSNGEGPGGGGGGGYIATAGGTPPVIATGGAAGTSNGSALSEFPYNGATGGSPGQNNASANLAAGTFYPSCVAADLVVTVTPGQSPIAPGGTALFTVTIYNDGPSPVVDARLSEQSPWMGMTASWTCSGSGGATCPSASGKGTITGAIDLPVLGMLTYVVSGPVPSQMTGGALTYTLSASPPNGYGDPKPTNNSASAMVAVSSGNTIDLAVRLAVSPPEPAIDEPVHYDFTVVNYGPGTTQAETVTINLPLNASVGALQLGDGWNCNTLGQSITCTRNAPLAAMQQTVLQLVVKPPPGATAMRVSAQVTAKDGADLNALDNNVRSDIVLGNSTVYATGGGLGCAAASRNSVPPSTFLLFGLGLLVASLRRRLRRGSWGGRG